MKKRNVLKKRIVAAVFSILLCLTGCVNGEVSDGSDSGTYPLPGYSDDSRGEGPGSIETADPGTKEPELTEAGNCEDLKTDSRAFAVVDDGGELFLGRNMYEPLAPASITKVLTALVTVESVSLENRVVIPEQAVTEGLAIMSSGVRPSFKPGETVTVRDLLHALILPSTNSAGNILAIHVAGSVPAFVTMMNEKMAELGLTHSHFMNPHGLDEDQHYSCAYDMAMVLRAAVRNETLKTILGTMYYAIPATEYTEMRSFQNTHPILNGNLPVSGAFAGKPGSTYLAKSTLLTAFERDGKRFYVCTMHSDEGYASLDTRNIVEYAYARYNGTKTTLEPFPYDVQVISEDVSGVTVRYSTAHSVESVRLVYWHLKTGTGSAVFINGTASGRNVECRIPLTEKGVYQIQVFTMNRYGNERVVQKAFLYDGILNTEGVLDWNGQRYAFDEKGMIRFGAVEYPDACYYANADGGLGKGFIGQFYAGNDYKLVSGWFEFGGQKFYCQADGRLAKGRLIVDGVLHTFSDSGCLTE